MVYKYDVFISFSFQDSIIAKGLCSFLESNSIRCWLSNREVAIGESFARQIMQAISDSSVFILLCSENCYSSEHCLNEMEMAIRKNKAIIPFMLDDSEMGAEYEYFLSTKHWIKYNSDSWQSDILDALNNLLSNIPKASGVKEGQNFSSEIITTDENISEERRGWNVRTQDSVDNEKKDSVIKVASIIPCKVYIDGVFIGDLGEREIVHIPVNFGSYIVSFEAPDKSEIYSIMAVDINTGQLTKAIVPDISQKYLSSKVNRRNERQELKCFIAGSKSMVAERDKMRAVVSNMYVNWKSRNMLIEVYSFDNFQHTMSENGHQEEYNQFIKNDADLVLFIFDNTVGDITLQELDIAIAAYKKSDRPKRPKIIIYVRKYNKPTEVIESLTERLKKEDVYWVEYETIEKLGLAFEQDLNDFLFRKVMVETIDG